MGVLREKMVREMLLRGFTTGTQKVYAGAVAGLAKHYGRSPDQITVEEAKAYLHCLLADRQKHGTTVNIVSVALRFFYREVLGQPEAALAIPVSRVSKRLPQVLSAEEVARLFAVAANLKPRTLLMTAYASGLRVAELARLRVTDIDSRRMMIRVESGKGRKDRYTVLSPQLIEALRTYWRAGQRAANTCPIRFQFAPRHHRPLLALLCLGSEFKWNRIGRFCERLLPIRCC